MMDTIGTIVSSNAGAGGGDGERGHRARTSGDIQSERADGGPSLVSPSSTRSRGRASGGEWGCGDGINVNEEN